MNRAMHYTGALVTLTVVLFHLWGCTTTIKVVHSGTITIQGQDLDLDPGHALDLDSDTLKITKHDLDLAPVILPFDSRDWFGGGGTINVGPGGTLKLTPSQDYAPDDLRHVIITDGFYLEPFDMDMDTPLDITILGGDGIYLTDDGNGNVIITAEDDSTKTFTIDPQDWQMDRPSEMKVCAHKSMITFVIGNDKRCQCLDCGFTTPGECQ